MKNAILTMNSNDVKGMTLIEYYGHTHYHKDQNGKIYGYLWSDYCG